MGLPGFKDLCSSLMQSEGTQAKMMVDYLKDVSAMLCFIAAVRGGNIEAHLAAERMPLPKCFAFRHVIYARYLTFQHVNLQNVKLNHKAAWNDLVQSRFGGSMSGEPFSRIHGDLITKTKINRELKVRGGPMHDGYSTSEQTTDTFIKTSHIMAKLIATLKERLDILTSSTHKEINIEQGLVRQLDKYLDPFLIDFARHMKTGVEIDHNIVRGLLSSMEAGEKCSRDFLLTRDAKPQGKTAFLIDKIVNLKIRTGQEKAKKDPKAVNILKENRQAFGLLVGLFHLL